MSKAITDIREVPASFSDFARQAGVDATAKLLQEYGGQRKYIPERTEGLGEDHWLVKCVGRDASKVLSSMYGREWIDLPNAKYASAKKIQIAFAEGSSNDVAKQFNVTTRWVRECRAMFGTSRVPSYNLSKYAIKFAEKYGISQLISFSQMCARFPTKGLAISSKYERNASYFGPKIAGQLGADFQGVRIEIFAKTEKIQKVISDIKNSSETPEQIAQERNLPLKFVQLCREWQPSSSLSTHSTSSE